MKGIGLFILSLVPVIYGFLKGEELNRAAACKAALIDFFEAIRLEISLYRREQKTLFENYENPILEKIGFLPRLRKEVKEKPCLALDRSIAELPESMKLTPLERRALSEFTKNFGMQSHASQLQDFEKLLCVLKEEDLRTRRDLPAKIKLARTLGITLGLGIYILLI